MNYLSYILILILLFSCKEHSNLQNAKNIQITTKSIILNKELSQMSYCEDLGTNTLDNCFCKIDNERYLKKETYVFDNDMKPISFYHYLPEGPDIHSVEQMKVDTLYANMVNFFNQKVIFDYENKFIIDGIDTIRNYKIFRDESLILINRSEYVNQPLSENRLVILMFETK